MYTTECVCKKSPRGCDIFCGFDIFAFNTSQYYCTHCISTVFLRVVQMKPVFWILGEGVEAIKVVPMGIETGFLLTHRWNLRTTEALRSSYDLNLWPFITSLRVG
jgi:hypothetical protein